MKVQCVVILPGLDRADVPAQYRSQRNIPVELNVGCEYWQSEASFREGLCDLLFAGFGNHPGLWDGFEEHRFDSGDEGINNVHRQWELAKTRSMSVGDVVVIDPDGLNEHWICEGCGWNRLTPEQAKSWLDYPRQYGCCGFEISAWRKSA